MKTKLNKAGVLGELHKDHDTGLTYKCVSVYSDSMGHIDCDWVVVEEVLEETEKDTERRQPNRNNYTKRS